MTVLSSEFSFINSLLQKNKCDQPLLIRGIGDDCAIFKGPGNDDYVISADALIEHVHFKLDFMSEYQLGYKSLAVNISDIAAMGGMPLFYLVSIAIPSHVTLDQAKLMMNGMAAIASQHNMILIGGDTVKSGAELMMSITVIGRCISGNAWQRSHAHAGDGIYVTGPLGWSALGLHCLMHDHDPHIFSNYINAHISPQPRCDVVSAFAKDACIHAAIDSSDGLISDLNHIADQSQLGYAIDIASLMQDSDMLCHMQQLNCDSHAMIASGGEDYELILTIASDKCAHFEQVCNEHGMATYYLGHMHSTCSHRNVVCNGKAISLLHTGHDHFES